MMKVLWISAGVVAAALVAMLWAPAGQGDPFGTLFRAGLAAALLVFLGRFAGAAVHRRPPRPLFPRVAITAVVLVVVEVVAVWFSPSLAIDLAVWYVALFATGLLLNRWCDAPDRYAVAMATFSVALSSVILMTLSLASTRQPDLAANTTLLTVWKHVARIAGIPTDAAWTWLAWRVADRFRPAEANRPKVGARVVAKPVPPKRPA